MRALMRAHALTLCIALLASTASARADVASDSCIDANAKAQALRRDGKLAAARAQLALCVDSRCPGMVRDDCAKRLDELDRAQPTIVFGGEDASARDVLAVAVAVDGRPVADKLDGSPLRVDPGPHVFRFEAAGQPPVTRTFVLKEGEKGRIERVVLGPTQPGESASGRARTADGSASDANEGHGLGGGKIAGIVLTALGVGGLAVGTAYGLLASSAWDKSKNECPTSCAEPNHGRAVNDRAIAVTDGTVSTIGFVAGGVFFAGGVALIVASPSPRGGSARSSGLRVTPVLGAGTAGLDLRGEF
jgi:hypothetical protein